MLCYVVSCCVLIQAAAEPKAAAVVPAVPAVPAVVPGKAVVVPAVVPAVAASWFFLGHFFLLTQRVAEF